MERQSFGRRIFVKGAGAIGAFSVFGTGITVARQGPPTGEEPDVVEWEGHGDEHADLSDCVAGAHWHWVLTPGGSNAPVVADGYPTLFVTFTDGTEETAEGYRNGYGTNGAVHFDIFTDVGKEVESAFAELNGGGSDLSILTISDGRCEPEEFLDFWQVDLIHGEPIEDFTEDGGTSYGEQQRLLQALWYPGDRVEDFLDHNDDEYAHCDVTVVEDITFHEATETATATIHIGNTDDCGAEDFLLVAYDSEHPHWGQVDDPWDGGEGQVLFDVSDGWDEVDDHTFRYTVNVPH